MAIHMWEKKSKYWTLTREGTNPPPRSIKDVILATIERIIQLPSLLQIPLIAPCV
jgi:hypothetical protein